MYYFKYALYYCVIFSNFVQLQALCDFLKVCRDLGEGAILGLYQVGNTSSRKNTEVRQLGPQLALGWVTIQGVKRGCCS